MHPILKVAYNRLRRGKDISIATPIDYADVRGRADALCCSLAFGDGDPVQVMRQARTALADLQRHRRHLRAKRRWQNA